MKLGLLELRRTPGKFLAVSGAVGFVVFLALVLAALSDGLYLGSTGAYRSSSADIFVFSAGSDFELGGSVVDDEFVDQVASVGGVEDVGRLSTFNTTAISDGEELQLSLMGADPPTMPDEIVAGRLPEGGALEVIVDQQTQRRGIDIGSRIAVTDGPRLEVVGVASDAGFGFTTAWANHDVFHEVRAEVRPELVGLRGSAQALGVAVADPESAMTVAGRIEGIDGLSVASAQAAIDALPAASQQKSTLDAIVYTTFAVAAIVVGLFFALVTLEKISEYAVLKAIGMSSWKLIGAVFLQALATSMAGFVVGFGLSRLAGALIPPDVPALFLGNTAMFLLAVTLVMGAVGAVFSFRRVIRIDAATALGGAP
jgi:putative ABC transport system permease protein